MVIFHSYVKMLEVKSTDNCPPGLLSSTAPVGWWTWDPSELLVDPTTAQSRWVPLIYKRTTVTGGGGDSRTMKRRGSFRFSPFSILWCILMSYELGSIGKCWEQSVLPFILDLEHVGSSGLSFGVGMTPLLAFGLTSLYQNLHGICHPKRSMYATFGPNRKWPVLIYMIKLYICIYIYVWMLYTCIYITYTHVFIYIYRHR